MDNFSEIISIKCNQFFKKILINIDYIDIKLKRNI